MDTAIKEVKESIKQLLDIQIELIYKYHIGGDVDGLADDFPFFSLYINIKKELYETLISKLYAEGFDLESWVNTLKSDYREYIEGEFPLSITDNGIDYPPLSYFEAPKSKYNYTRFELFEFQRYILGLEWILVNSRFEKLVHRLYAVFYIRESTNWSAATLKETIPMAQKITARVLEKIYSNLSEMPFEDLDLGDLDFEDDAEEIILTEYNEAKKTFYNYARSLRNVSEFDTRELYNNEVLPSNLWLIEDRAAFGCFVEKEGAEPDWVYAVTPWINETLLKNFHLAKGYTLAHLNKNYRAELSKKLKQFIDLGYATKTGWTYDGVYFDSPNNFELDTDLQSNSKWLYLKHVKTQKYDEEGKVIVEVGPEVVLDGKPKLLHTYMSFIDILFKVVEIPAYKIDKESIFSILKKTYLAMHKVVVCQAMSVMTSRKGSIISKTELQKELHIGNPSWGPLMKYYTPDKFNNEKILEINEKIGFEIPLRKYE